MSRLVFQFQRAALQRFEDAETLLEQQRKTGAMYLAGYAVECMLKALLLSQTPLTRLIDLVKPFHGRLAYNFDWLKLGLRRSGVNIPSEALRQLVTINTWSTDLRYSSGSKKWQEAHAFLKAAESIVLWVERTL